MNLVKSVRRQLCISVFRLFGDRVRGICRKIIRSIHDGTLHLVRVFTDRYPKGREVWICQDGHIEVSPVEAEYDDYGAITNLRIQPDVQYTVSQSVSETGWHYLVVTFPNYPDLEILTSPEPYECISQLRINGVKHCGTTDYYSDVLPRLFSVNEI